MDTLRVGIIGANARGGWASESHVPAVQRLSGLSLEAVATSRQETAAEAARKFGVTKSYGSGMELIADPDIDLVTVTTRVPQHRELVLAALQAGKHVLCEWPLGRSSKEAGEMAAAAARAGIHDAIGLQLRASPAAARARDTIESGAIGRVLSVSGLSTVAGFGPEVPAAFAYTEDPASFANLVTIQSAHTLDLVFALLGQPTSASALASRLWPTIVVDHETQKRETFDHLLVQGTLADSVPFHVEVAGGRKPDDTPFWLEVRGEDGVLRLAGGAPRGLQAGRITLERDGKPVAVDEGELAGMTDAAANVAGVYASLRDDIRGGSRRTRGFEHAVGLTRLVEGLFVSSRTGQRLDASAVATSRP